MKNRNSIQFITSKNASLSIFNQVVRACKGGIRWIQYRSKDSSDEIFLNEAIKIKSACRDYGATFIINDKVHIAREVGADGVHLGETDMLPDEARRILGDNKIIGFTVNCLSHVKNSVGYPINYLGLGPLRVTQTKRNLSSVLGFEGMEKLLASIKQAHGLIPVVAVGGVTFLDLPLLNRLGLSGVAVSSAITKNNIEKESAKFIKYQWIN